MSQNAQGRSLCEPGLMCPGHEAMSGTRMPPSCSEPFPQPVSDLKGPPLLNHGESVPPLKVGPLSEVKITTVFS